MALNRHTSYWVKHQHGGAKRKPWPSFVSRAREPEPAPVAAPTYLDTPMITALRRLSWPKPPLVYAKGRQISTANAPAAALARELAEQGRVCLTQRRLPDGEYEYLATPVRPDRPIAHELHHRRAITTTNWRSK